jgi:hypothetical protein
MAGKDGGKVRLDKENIDYIKSLIKLQFID